MKLKWFLPLLVLNFVTLGLNAQVYSNKVLNEKDKARLDSIASEEYSYLLPIWGKKVTALGFDLPYSAGFSLNYLGQRSELIIDNLNVGVNNGPLVNLDQVVRFNNVEGTTRGLNVRPDFWLFPFLNIYGILASSRTSTEVDFGIWLPNGTSEEEIFNYVTKAEFDATSLGFGITPTMGVGGGWLALDMNFTWTDIPELEKPAYSFIFGPRLGKSFSLGKPESNIAIWVGGFRVNLSSETSGIISLSEVLPEDGNLSTKIENGLEAVATRQMDLDNWYNDLTPAQQRLNQIKYDAANRVLEAAHNSLTRIDEATEAAEQSTISYTLDKRLKDKWNFVIGSQLQINKHWMVRAEIGFLKSRQQIITGIQYRFGL